jgi:hypothetical protein
VVGVVIVDIIVTVSVMMIRRIVSVGVSVSDASLAASVTIVASAVVAPHMPTPHAIGIMTNTIIVTITVVEHQT